MPLNLEQRNIISNSNGLISSNLIRYATVLNKHKDIDSKLNIIIHWISKEGMTCKVSKRLIKWVYWKESNNV